MKKRRNRVRRDLGWLLLPVFAALALVIFAGAVDSLTVGRSVEDRQQMEQALRRSCVACYAAEGRYPPDLEYLQERYTVIYDIFAPNLMPDITVLELEP